MAEKFENQAVGGKESASTPDGTNAVDGGGESAGGAYPNPHDDAEEGRFQGGQSERDYSGGPGGNDNAGAGTD